VYIETSQSCPIASVSTVIDLDEAELREHIADAQDIADELRRLAAEGNQFARSAKATAPAADIA
jgi:hypothetical protein